MGITEWHQDIGNKTMYQIHHMVYMKRLRMGNCYLDVENKRICWKTYN